MRYFNDSCTKPGSESSNVDDIVPPKTANFIFEETALSRRDFALYDAIAAWAMRHTSACEELFIDYGSSDVFTFSALNVLTIEAVIMPCCICPKHIRSW